MLSMKQLRAAYRKYGNGCGLRKFVQNYLNGPAILKLAHANARKKPVSKRLEKAPKAKK